MIECKNCANADNDYCFACDNGNHFKPILKRGSIIQANENAGMWVGTVLIVDEVKSWGVQAFVHVPMNGDAYIRLQPEQYEVLSGGEAALMPGGDDD